jgi:hypothetical protein
MAAVPLLMMWSISLSTVGRAVIADVASSAENNGTAMKKVADRLVRRFVRRFVGLGQRKNISAVILSMKAHPQPTTWTRILTTSGRRHLRRPINRGVTRA